MLKHKIIALRYDENSGAVLAMDEFESVTNALGVIEETNAEYRSVGYFAPWVVYLVEGNHWFELTNEDKAWARFEFIHFLKSVGGSYGNFHAANFEAPDREDF